MMNLREMSNGTSGALLFCSHLCQINALSRMKIDAQRGSNSLEY
jgi:hypothetical protein